MSDLSGAGGGGAPVENLEDLYENAPCGYLSLDRRGRIVKANATFATWLGVDREHLLGKRLLELLNVAGAMFYETHFAPLLRMQGYFNEIALDFRKADGSTLATLANAMERRDEDGELVFTRVTIFQATDRRRYERELVEARRASDEARRELERGLLAERVSSDLREQFVAVLGHDLRNPLAAIDAGLKLLRREELSEKGEQIVTLMGASVGRMSRLIDDVMDLARSRLGGGIVLERSTRQNIAQTTGQVVAELQTAHPDHEIILSVNVSEPASVDHGRFAQVVSNLLGNALTHGDGDAAVRVALEVASGRVSLVVANRGEPIPPEIQTRLFQPFSRGGTAKGARGLGLGLFIASEIVSAHGGRIDVESGPDETRFIASMPCFPADDGR